MKRSEMIFTLLSAATLSSCSTTSKAKIDAVASARLRAMSAKLAAAKTLRFAAVRESSPGFTVGVTVPERATVTGVVQRPNRVVSHATTSLGRRSFTYDGSKLTVIDRAAGTHAEVASPGGIDATLSRISETYGYMLPLSEILANDPERFLLKGVETVTSTGRETIAGRLCERLHFVQAGFSWDLWIDAATDLPVRVSVAYPEGSGGKPLTSTATLTSLQLNASVSEAELSVTPPAESRAIEMVPIAE
ncbi:MAG: DUF2092 domain-containing protein [Verrucomicrobiales bacterium]|nr:DUF2092 domain-containing protein [Verrucomicrobiales bacterium]